MTVNYYLKCPSCSSITRMRSPAGYLEKTPVRIHCGKCNTLLTGNLFCDNKKIRCYYESTNCDRVEPQEYQFYGEAAGELLSRKICENTDNIPPMTPHSVSPALTSMFKVNVNVSESYIDFTRHISELNEKWDKRRILYDLYIQKHFNLIKQNYSDIAHKAGYILTNDFDFHRYIHYHYMYDFGGIFGNNEIKHRLRQINNEFYHINKDSLMEFKNYLDSHHRIARTQSDVFDIMNNYIGISLNIMPALYATLFNDPDGIDKEDLGLSTCSFEDIKNFYIDAYEALANSCDIVIGLDNIKSRGAYSNFSEDLTMKKLNAKNKGLRIKHLDNTEFFANCFGLKDNTNQLRNAIGHKDYSYNGLTQILTYTPDATRPNKVKTIYLLDIAIMCVELMRSSIILEFILYEFIREDYRTITPVMLHPLFYSGAKSNNHCPCGSGKKYTKCCKDWVNKNKKVVQDLTLPSKTVMQYNPDQMLDLIKQYSSRINRDDN